MSKLQATLTLYIYSRESGIALTRMSDLNKTDFLSLQGEKYAASLLKAGMFDTLELARELASSQVHSILSKEDEEHFFALIWDEVRDVRVGNLWWARRRQNNTVWIYDIEVDEKERRRGYARKCLKSLESWAAVEKVRSIALNVFAYNYEAEKLYQEIGYKDVSKHMRKDL